MERNSITAAPAVAAPMSLYDEWHRDNHGTRRDFLRFLTTPGVGRDRFLSARETEMLAVGSIVTPLCKV